jgi:hypothetical protein
MLERSLETSLAQCIETHKYWMKKEIDSKLSKALDFEIEKRVSEGVNERLKKALEG